MPKSEIAWMRIAYFAWKCGKANRTWLWTEAAIYRHGVQFYGENKIDKQSKSLAASLLELEKLFNVSYRRRPKDTILSPADILSFAKDILNETKPNT